MGMSLSRAHDPADITRQVRDRSLWNAPRFVTDATTVSCHTSSSMCSALSLIVQQATIVNVALGHECV